MIISKRRYDMLMSYAAKYDKAENIIDNVYDVVLSPTRNYSVLKINYDDVQCEAGIVVGLNNENYKEIKELAQKGSK